MDSVGELRLRELIMHALAEATAESGFVTRAQLSALEVAGMPRRVIDQGRGIWNPTTMSATLSIISDPLSEYDDIQESDSLFRYAYQRGTDAGVHKKLRKAQELELPIIMLRTIAPGRYVPVFPVYVVGDDQAKRQFVLALDESLRFLRDPLHLSADERRYAERVVQQRLHQPEFRGRIMRAYDTQCAVCRLKHGRLLDAAHITEDGDDAGLPIVTNGLSLCKIHHAAYDANLLGISPDYVVHIDRDLLEERDGPMLKHGLQEMDKARLQLPTRRRERPDRDRLAQRFAGFGAAG
ncbi:HNH endonuclease [Mumia quercus]|uniref:HNH endonuclease n=1 Tax=Mumia quercus TaxID=2976125 RepID=UPI0021D0063C|nr:HNH endonuclease [Mumia quercus]